MSSCTTKTAVDLIVHNANVYTVDEQFSKAEAFAVKDGIFVAVGNDNDIMYCSVLAYLMPSDVKGAGYQLLR